MEQNTPLLTKAERNYTQIEREAAAGIAKFHSYIYGGKFTLITDYKPLTTIFSPKSSLPALTSARLQRWAIILSTYQYDDMISIIIKQNNHGCLVNCPSLAIT